MRPWYESQLTVKCRTDNAAKNRWATISKRHPNQQQPGSTNSTLSSASNATHNAASDAPQAESASALQTALLTTDTATTQTEPGPVSTPPAMGDNAASLKDNPSATVSSQVSDSPQQGKCRSGDASPHQCNASSAAMAGPSSRRLAHMASMRSINSRHKAALPTVAARSMTPSPSASVPMTVSTDSTALLEKRNGLSCSCGLSPQAPLVQIDSCCSAHQPTHQTPQIEKHCPAYQPKVQSPRGTQAMQGIVQCTTAAAVTQDQSPDQPMTLQGLDQEVPQGLAKLPSSDETTQVCQAGACIPAGLEVQGLEPTQGFPQLPSAARLSLTACSATCLAYLAGVMDERRREKDPNMQMHIDRAWRKLPLLLAGLLSLFDSCQRLFHQDVAFFCKVGCMILPALNQSLRLLCVVIAHVSLHKSMI